MGSATRKEGLCPPPSDNDEGHPSVRHEDAWSVGYAFSLWEHAARLRWRAAARGGDSAFFLNEAEKMLDELAHHLGRRPKDQEDLRSLMDKSRD